MAFPCNQFAKEEPGTEAEIKKYVTRTYGAKFLLFSKIEVNGKGTHPLYQHLRKHSQLYDVAKQASGDIPWNFAKFLVDSDGQVRHFFAPDVNPLSFKDQIEQML